MTRRSSDWDVRPAYPGALGPPPPAPTPQNYVVSNGYDNLVVYQGQQVTYDR